MVDLLKSFLKLLAVVVVFFIAIFYCWYWVDGVAQGLNWVGVPIWLGFIIVIVGMCFAYNKLSLVFTGIGIVASIALVGWPWYGAIAFYLPTLSFIFGFVIIDWFVDLVMILTSHKYIRHFKKTKAPK